MANDLISVIIPVYNIERYLTKCVESVLNQTYHNLEIILVDDGSEIETAQLCDNLALKDERIVVIHKTNGGLSSARNMGIEKSKGNLIAFIDGDDYIENDMFEKLYISLKHNDADIAICSFQMEDENQNIVDKCPALLEGTYTNLEALDLLSQEKQFRYVVAWNKLYKKEIFEKIRFPEGKLFEDQAIAHYVFWQARKIVTISNVLYHYLVRTNSLSRQTNPLKYLDDIDALFDRIEFYKKNNLNNLIVGVEKILFQLFGLYMQYAFLYGQLENKNALIYKNYCKKCKKIFIECQTLKKYSHNEKKARAKIYNFTLLKKLKLKHAKKIRTSSFFKLPLKIYRKFAKNK